MRELVWSNRFVRTFKKYLKRHPEARKSIEETLNRLATDPFAPQLATHKLKGPLAAFWACSAGYDLRILFVFVKNEAGGEDDIFLSEIGTHDEAY